MTGSGTKDLPIEFPSDEDSWSSGPERAPKAPKRPKFIMGRTPKLLNDLPLEIFNMVINSPALTNVDRRSLKMTSKALRNSTIRTTNPTKSEFKLFNKQFEASIPHFSTSPLAQRLLCQNCNHFLHRNKFPDAHTQAVCKAKARTCLRCSIKLGDFHRRCFKYLDTMHFICEACRECKEVEADMKTVKKGTKFTVWQKFGDRRTVDTKVDVSERRWCKTCWKAMDGFWRFVGEKGKIKEKWR